MSVSAGLKVLSGNISAKEPVLYTTEDFPIECCCFKQLETSELRRDAVCKAFNLRYKQIGRDGNCFFESVSATLAFVPSPGGEGNLLLNPKFLRYLCTTWLKKCVDQDEKLDPLIIEECCKLMKAELVRPLVGTATKTGKAIPTSIVSYLELSANDGVWVEGTHL